MAERCREHLRRRAQHGTSSFFVPPAWTDRAEATRGAPALALAL
jgi:hypothetical protein